MNSLLPYAHEGHQSQRSSGHTAHAPKANRMFMEGEPLCLHGLMVMTFASHAKGSEFDPRCEYLFSPTATPKSISSHLATASPAVALL